MNQSKRRKGNSLKHRLVMTSWGNNMWLAGDYKLVPSKTDEWNSVQKVENRRNIKNEAKYM